MVELYTQREALADYVASERWEGRKEGRAEGRTEGELAKAKKTAQKMFCRGNDLIDIAEILEVSIQQVEEWVGLVTA